MIKKTAVLAAMMVFLSGCLFSGQYKSVRDYCNQNPSICLLVGAAIVAGIIVATQSDGRDGDSGGGYGGGMMASDIRLKENLRHVGTLENGLRLHAYQYKNDNRYFVGVLAQEVLELPEYAGAVVELDNGYLAVDYSKLDVRVLNAHVMEAASAKVLSSL